MNKTTIITGANHGIGYEAARLLASDKTRTLVLTGRDPDRLAGAVNRIRRETDNAHIISMQMELGSLDSVLTFYDDYRKRDLPPLEAIMCNAGISLPTVKRRSADGYEETFAVNHLGHFLLVNLFLDLLEPPARILFVSSGAHDPVATRGRMEAPRFIRAEWLAFPDQDPDLPPDDARAGGQAYASSKLCNVLCTYELFRRLTADGKSTADRPITVNAFDPGLVAGTGLGRNGKTLIRFTWFYLLPALSRLFGFGRSVQQAGTDLAYLARAPELRNVTGKYFSGRKLVKSSAESYDENKAADLWQTSLKLCRLPSTN